MLDNKKARETLKEKAKEEPNIIKADNFLRQESYKNDSFGQDLNKQEKEIQNNINNNDSINKQEISSNVEITKSSSFGNIGNQFNKEKIKIENIEENEESKEDSSSESEPSKISAHRPKYKKSILCNNSYIFFEKNKYRSNNKSFLK